MNTRRYYLTVILLCACGGVNVLFYVLTDSEASRRDGSIVGLNANQGQQFVISDPRLSGTSKTDYDDDTFHRNSGVHSFIRKLNNAESPELAKRPEYDERADSEDYTRLYEFLINNVELCGDADDKTNNIVIVVTSRINNFLRRNAIRDTWGSTVKDVNGTILFLVGVNNNDKYQHQVEKESELYADIVQVNILDTYDNLTYKSIAMLQWLTDYCSNSKYYLKADDDVYVNVHNVLNESTKQRHEEFFLCHVFNKAPPIRDPNSKWYVSRDHYSKDYFPTYCSGTAYVFSTSIVNKLYLSTLKAKLCLLEDVFITGIAAEGKNITFVHNGAFDFNRRRPTGCDFANALSGHQVTPTQMYLIFAQLTSREIDCETKTNRVLKKAEKELARYSHRK